MLINVEKENLIVRSRVTERKYQVYKINIENNKVTGYLICNQGSMELWDTKRFYPLEDISRIIDLEVRNKELEKENMYLKEYIWRAPNLNEMTAVAYRHIQEDAYIRGRAEEQRRAEEIIYNHYIPKSMIKEKIKELYSKLGVVKADRIKANRIIGKIEVLEELAGDE